MDIDGVGVSVVELHVLFEGADAHDVVFAVYGNLVAGADLP